MGNGSGLKYPGVLTIEDIEAAAQAALNNFGKNPIIFMPPQFFSMPWESHPEYSGTPYSTMGKLTKREQKVAALTTFLKKLKVLKNVSDEELVDIKNTTVKRLKRAKWAQYNRKKV